jgi:hypothetical protein
MQDTMKRIKKTYLESGLHFVLLEDEKIHVPGGKCLKLARCLLLLWLD